MTKPETGSLAPDFDLPADGGKRIRLSSLRGRKVVLYFYPKDDTPGCTKEACDFRDNLGRAKAPGVVVYGVSKDSLASHERFRVKYSLPFELLSDEDNAVAKAWGAYGTKTMYGKKVLGTIRSTFLIDEQGKVAAVWSPVKVDGHVEKVLAALSGKGEGEAAPVKKAARKSAAAKPAAPKKAAKKTAAKAPAAKKKASLKKK